MCSKCSEQLDFLILTRTVVEDLLYTKSRIIFESSLLEKDHVIGARNITTTVESLFSSSCLFQVDGYCIDVPWGMFSYNEKPINLVDIIADEVVISDWVNDESINQHFVLSIAHL